MSNWMQGMDSITNLLGFGWGIGSYFLGRRDYERYREEDWAREDSAIQRRVEDMRAAGLNPILAAGQPAQAQATASRPPNQELDGSNLIALMTMKKNLEVADAEIDLMKAQAEEARSRKPLHETHKELYSSEIDLNEQMHAHRTLMNPETEEQIKIVNELKSRLGNLEAENMRVKNDLLHRQHEIEKEYDQEMARLRAEGQATQNELNALKVQEQKVISMIAENYGLDMAEAELFLKDLLIEENLININYASTRGRPVGNTASGIAGIFAWLIDQGMGIATGVSNIIDNARSGISRRRNQILRRGRDYD